ncbi:MULTISPECIES: hypothetical protein [Thermodesulfovibrio]|jgi:hypothetical protein|uniref:hypothetical protein n=1 Tax=Thermodesulfovibrio TaxID=28261 RepID=UPI002616C263|nr:hypothetical protein [Thermodesulfovibrio sp.]
MKKKILTAVAAVAVVFLIATAQAETGKNAQLGVGMAKSTSIVCPVTYEFNNPIYSNSYVYETTITAENIEKARKKLLSEEFLRKIADEMDQQENAQKIQLKKGSNSFYSEKITMTCRDEKQQTHIYEISAVIKK